MSDYSTHIGGLDHHDGTLHHHGPISGIAAAQGYVATAGYDNQLILWDAGSRRALARALHDHLVNHCAFSHDGSLLVSASSDYSARIYALPSMRLRAALIGHGDDVDMAVFSPDDQRVATCALDRTIRIFDLDGRCLKVLTGHTGNILSLAWSRDGSRLVSSSVDGTVREWDAAGGVAIRCNTLDEVRTDTLAIDKDGRIFAGDDLGRILVIVDGRINATRAHEAGIKKLVHDEANGLIVTLSYDRSIAVWRVEADESLVELSRSEYPAEVWARSGAFLPDGRLAVGTFGSHYAVFDWRAQTWDIDGVQVGRGLNAVAALGRDVYAIGDAGALLCNGVKVGELGSLCNFLLPAGDLLLTGGQLGRLFDARTGRLLYQHHSPLNCGTAFLRRGKLHAAIGTYTGEVLLFAFAADGAIELIGTLKIYENAVKGLTANNDMLFSVCASTDIAWHRLDDFHLVRRIPKAHERIANGCCVAGDTGFASIGRDLKLRIWDGEREQVYPTPHPNSIKCIAVSADRQVIMTGAYTGTVAAFDLRTRTWRGMARPTAAGISSLAWHDEAGHFLASSYDGRIYTLA